MNILRSYNDKQYINPFEFSKKVINTLKEKKDLEFNMNIDNLFVLGKNKILVKIKEGDLHKYNYKNYGKDY